ncbi:hypothetical protein, partial [Sphingobium phenoxybenzoativorans]|uniref:hypothetical protein n=1 Tax=Sphingobium phenoxybenzoativorans TaxID=1592790 RepID=UPI001C0D862A
IAAPMAAHFLKEPIKDYWKKRERQEVERQIWHRQEEEARECLSQATPKKAQADALHDIRAGDRRLYFYAIFGPESSSAHVPGVLSRINDQEFPCDGKLPAGLGACLPLSAMVVLTGHKTMQRVEFARSHIIEPPHYWWDVYQTTGLIESPLVSQCFDARRKYITTYNGMKIDHFYPAAESE